MKGRVGVFLQGAGGSRRGTRWGDERGGGERGEAERALLAWAGGRAATSRICSIASARPAVKSCDGPLGGWSSGFARPSLSLTSVLPTSATSRKRTAGAKRGMRTCTVAYAESARTPTVARVTTKTL